MTVGDRIRNRRIELGLSQEDLAVKMGFSGKSTIAKAEARGDSITTNSIKKYAKALNVTEYYLLGWSDDEVKSFDEGFQDAELLNKYHQLTSDHKEMVNKQIDLFLQMQE